MWFDFIAMRFVADTADFPAICHVSDAKDITRNRRETSLRHEQFGKGIVKYNGFKQNFTLFCSTSEPKGVSFTLWIFRWRIFDRRDVLYALGNDKVENDQPPEAANVLCWFEKVPYLLCWKLGRTLWFYSLGFEFFSVGQTKPTLLVRFCQFDRWHIRNFNPWPYTQLHVLLSFGSNEFPSISYQPDWIFM